MSYLKQVRDYVVQELPFTVFRPSLVRHRILFSELARIFREQKAEKSHFKG